MLSAADKDVIDRERSLPGMALLLDNEAVTAILRAEAPEAEVSDLNANYVRYKPGTSCLVGYELETSVGPVRAMGKALRPGDTAKLRKTRQSRTVSCAFDTVVLGEYGLAFATAVNDRKVHGLAALAGDTGGSIRRLLPDYDDVAMHTLRYKPERRWVGCVNAGGDPVAVVRAYAQKDFYRAERAWSALHTSPRALTTRRGIGVIVTTWVPGTPLAHHALSSTETAYKVGVALARFHGMHHDELPEVACPRLAIAAAVEHLRVIAPWARDRVDDLVDNIAPVLSSSRTGSSAGNVTLHGDFSADQVVLSNGSVTMIDLDEMGVGDAAIDLGSFRAALQTEGGNGWNPFIDGYASVGGLPSDERIYAHTVAAMIRLAVEPFRHRLENWPGEIDRLVGIAETTCRRA